MIASGTPVADSTWNHACLPPFQFQIEQHSTAEFEVREATHPWQFVAVIKGRSGPPLFASPWQAGPGKLSYQFFDLAAKKAVVEGHFQQRLKLEVPREGRHLFLLVSPNPGPMPKANHERQD